MRIKKIVIQRKCRKCKKIYLPTPKQQKMGNLCRQCFYALYPVDPKTKKLSQQKYKAVRSALAYGDWLAWVEKNKARRRAIALASYHRRKQAKSATKLEMPI